MSTVTGPGAEGFVRGSRRGSRARAVGVHGDWAAFRVDKLVLGIKGDEGPIERRMRAQGFTKGLSCTPREPLVNPSDTPGEPLKPLKEKYDPFMRTPAYSRRHNPLPRSQGFTGFTDWATVAAVVVLTWHLLTVATESGWPTAMALHGLAAASMAMVAVARREIVGWRTERSAEGRRDSSARWSRPRAESRALLRGHPRAERAALDSETSTIGSRYDRL